uniref:Uncharacterized protein n=1 Tax=Vespula pensylvanica TaxID=30213 RepID=A0A834UG43_VESPE|nr:hypothetical protein H0235_000742 [Vespula pensylvanica]
MVGLLLAAETCGRNVQSGNGKEETKQKNGLKGIATDEEDIYREKHRVYKEHRTPDYESRNTEYETLNTKYRIRNTKHGAWNMKHRSQITSLTCYTCVNVSDNQVSKSCASSAECGPSSVGCIPVDTQQICISCCDLSYCNIESPTNSTNAIYSRKRRAKSKSKRKRPGRNGVEGTDFKFYGSGVFWLLASIFYAYHC